MLRQKRIASVLVLASGAAFAEGKVGGSVKFNNGMGSYSSMQDGKEVTLDGKGVATELASGKSNKESNVPFFKPSASLNITQKKEAGDAYISGRAQFGVNPTGVGYEKTWAEFGLKDLVSFRFGKFDGADIYNLAISYDPLKKVGEDAEVFSVSDFMTDKYAASVVAHVGPVVLELKGGVNPPAAPKVKDAPTSEESIKKSARFVGSFESNGIKAVAGLEAGVFERNNGVTAVYGGNMSKKADENMVFAQSALNYGFTVGYDHGTMAGADFSFGMGTATHTDGSKVSTPKSDTETKMSKMAFGINAYYNAEGIPALAGPLGVLFGYHMGSEKTTEEFYNGDTKEVAGGQSVSKTNLFAHIKLPVVDKSNTLTLGYSLKSMRSQQLKAKGETDDTVKPADVSHSGFGLEIAHAF